MVDQIHDGRRRVWWHVRLWAGLAVGLLIMAMLLKQVDLAELGESLQSVHATLLVVTIIVYLSSFLFRVYQWKYVLADSAPRHLRHLYTALMIGFAGNCILPARAGEFIRAGVLARREKVPFTTSFASVMVTRLLDGFCFVGMFVVVLSVLEFNEPVVIPAGKFLTEPFEITPGTLHFATIAGTILFAGVGVCVVVTYFIRDKAVALAENVLKPVSAKLAHWVAAKLDTFIQGFAVFSRGGHLLGSVVTSVIAWVIAILSGYILLVAFDMGAHVPWYTAIVIAAFGNLGTMLPVSPGFVGTYHLGVVAAVKVANPAINYDVAVAFSIMLHAVQVMPIIVVGVLCMWAENMSIKGLQTAPEEENDDTGRVCNAEL